MMELNKDGTATLTVNRKTLTLENPSRGNLKRLKKKLTEISTTLSSHYSDGYDALSDGAKGLVDLSRKADEVSEDVLQKIEDATSEEDTEEFMKFVAYVAELPAMIADSITEWWVDAINSLNVEGVTVEEDDIPSALTNQEAIADWVRHVETNPFLSGRR